MFTTTQTCLCALFAGIAGQRYDPHHDYFSFDGADDNGGNRLVSVLRVATAKMRAYAMPAMHACPFWLNL